MFKKILLMAFSAFFLAACDQGSQEVEVNADASPYATETGIDFTGFNEEANPRDDFFAYVNQGWLDRTEIPGDRGSYGSFGILRDDSEKNQQAIIEELAAMEGLEAGSIEQKIGDLYGSLLDASFVEGKGAAPIQAYLDKVDTIADYSDLVRTFGENQYVGVTSPMGTFVIPDLGDSTRYMSYIWQGGLGLPGKDYYTLEGEKYDEIRAAYPKYIAQMFELAGIDNGAERAANVVAIENRLAEGHWSPEKNRDIPALYNLREVANLSEINADVDWQTFLEGAGLGERAEIVVAQMSYFESMGEILTGFSIDAWKDYLKFHALNGAATFLSSEFEDADFAFNGALIGGREEKTPRWKNAVRVVNATLGEGVGKVYVDRHFPPEAKAQMEQLVANLMVAFEDGIRNLEWMSEETKAAAEGKRQKMMTKIGYPDEWETYEGMEMVADDPIANLASATAWAYQDALNKLDGPIDRGEWGMTPQTVNAYHNPTMNEIVFPAAILQPPFFNLSSDPAVNYGGIGAVIGHEIGHAFDDNGRRFDGDGNLRDWWTEADAEKFEAAAAKLVAQYDGFEPLEDLNVNGQLTLGENIGDLTGVTLAYKAYKMSLNGEEAPVIDGLTGDQRFFIGFAQIWRNKYREESLRNLVLTNPHSPSQYRTNGTLANFTPFYDAFGIVEGDGMFLPEDERVKIW